MKSKEIMPEQIRQDLLLSETGDAFTTKKAIEALTAAEAENERLLDGLKELEDLVPQNTRLSEIIQTLLTLTK